MAHAAWLLRSAYAAASASIKAVPAKNLHPKYCFPSSLPLVSIATDHLLFVCLVWFITTITNTLVANVLQEVLEAARRGDDRCGGGTVEL